MSALSIQIPYPIFSDRDGQPLENGYVWIGQPYLDPQTNPVQVYLDDALTIPVAQPLRTIGGYVSNSGTPAQLYVNGVNFSIRVQDNKGTLVYYFPDGSGINPDAAGVTYNPGPDSLLLPGGPISVKAALDEITDDETGSSVVGFLQAGTGAVARTAQSKMRDVVSVLDFGASPAASAAVNTAAIQAAADYCETNGAFLQGAPGTYSTSGTITFNCSGDLSEMTISCPGATVSPAVRVGKTTGSLSGIRLLLKLPKINNSSKTVPGWSGFESSIGVDIGNLYYSEITILRVFGFGINLYVGGYTVGNAYNQYHILQLVDGKVNMKLGGRAPGAWSNENNYFCGNFARSSTEGTSPITGAYSIWLDGITGTNVNNNVFYKPSVETDSDQFQFNFEDASSNTVINPRFEVTGGGRVRLYSSTAGETSDNNFFGGYQTPRPLFTFDGASSRQNKYYGSRQGDSLEFAGDGIKLVNTSGSGISTPHIQGFEAGQNALAKSSSSTDWTYRLYADGLDFKEAASAFSHININGPAERILFGGGSAAPIVGIGGTASNLALITPTGAGVRPDFDNTVSMGLSGYRWSVVYAGTPTINTSDEREKQDITYLDAAEKRVAAALKGLVKKFRFKDAVKNKGDGARIHVGVIAQEVIAAFQAEGLDPMRYAIVCYDEWDTELDDDGNEVRPAGNRYGVRYEELLAFIIAAL